MTITNTNTLEFHAKYNRGGAVPLCREKDGVKYIVPGAYKAIII